MEYEGILMVEKKEELKARWEELYISYRKEVLWIALSCLQNFHQADDITQDVFIKLYKTILKGKELDNIKGWLYKTTIRTCLDFKKSFWNKLFSKKENYNILLSEEFKTFEDDNFKNLNKNLKKLPIKQRIAISLRFYKEMKINEIAKEMDISESSVKTHISRGLKKLKKIMEEKNETY